jgi:hypothetical protein
MRRGLRKSEVVSNVMEAKLYMWQQNFLSPQKVSAGNLSGDAANLYVSPGTS